MIKRSLQVIEAMTQYSASKLHHELRIHYLILYTTNKNAIFGGGTPISRRTCICPLSYHKITIFGTTLIYIKIQNDNILNE